MTTYNKKRFIAGAVCPTCKAMDKLMTYEFENNSYLECVSCGYKISENDDLPKAKEHTIKLPTRKSKNNDQ